MKQLVTLTIAAGAVIGNMALMFALLFRPHSIAALWVGLAAYAIAAAAWALHRPQE
jgi:hypothetical protein